MGLKKRILTLPKATKFRYPITLPRYQRHIIYKPNTAYVAGYKLA